MYHQEIKVTYLREQDLSEAMLLWKSNHVRYTQDGWFPSHWSQESEEQKQFLLSHIREKSAYAALWQKELVGFLAYDNFSFHGEPTAFCPYIAHAVREEYKQPGYFSLYQTVAARWAKEGITNHMWTVAFNDTQLRTLLFDVGFGSYLLDCFSTSDKSISVSGEVAIGRADPSDLERLAELVAASKQYYLSSPLFLQRDDYSNAELADLVATSNVFLAKVQGKVVGFANVTISKENNPIDISATGCGLIDEIGMFVLPEYRSNKVGSALLNAIFAQCRNNNSKLVHVDFETANLYGNRFWRKYFSPMLISMRRSLNQDIND